MAIPLFFGENTFIFRKDRWSTLNQVLRFISTDSRQHLRSIRVYLGRQDVEWGNEDISWGRTGDDPWEVLPADPTEDRTIKPRAEARPLKTFNKKALVQPAHPFFADSLAQIARQPRLQLSIVMLNPRSILGVDLANADLTELFSGECLFRSRDVYGRNVARLEFPLIRELSKSYKNRVTYEAHYGGMNEATIPKLLDFEGFGWEVISADLIRRNESVRHLHHVGYFVEGLAELRIRNETSDVYGSETHSRYGPGYRNGESSDDEDGGSEESGGQEVQDEVSDHNRVEIDMGKSSKEQLVEVEPLGEDEAHEGIDQASIGEIGEENEESDNSEIDHPNSESSEWWVNNFFTNGPVEDYHSSDDDDVWREPGPHVEDMDIYKAEVKVILRLR